MERVQQVLEVERIVNLAKGFGWEKTAEKIDGDKITLTIEKRLSLRPFGVSILIFYLSFLWL